MVQQMTPAAAFHVASQWGSYQRTGDPGACFYCFPFDDGRPAHEPHRRELLARIGELLARNLSPKDRAQLSALRDFFQVSETRQAAYSPS